MNALGRGEWAELSVRVPAERAGAVLLDVVGPLLAACRDAGAPALFLREAAGREHVTLVVQAAPPPGSAWSLAEHAGELARRLGGPDVTAGPAERVPLAGSTFDGAELAPVTRTFLAEVTPILLGLVRRDPASRAELLSGALDLMAGHLPAVGRSADRGAPLSFLSFRSHSEAFLASSRDPVAARTALDRRYESVRETVESRLRTILGELASDTPPAPSGPVAHGWYRAVRAAKPAVTEHFGTGGLGLLPDPQPEPGGDGFAASSFHSALAATPELHEFLRDDPAFLSVRLLTSLLYLSLHNLGLSLVERYFLCHAVSHACESLFDVDAVEMLKQVTASRHRVPAG